MTRAFLSFAPAIMASGIAPAKPFLPVFAPGSVLAAPEMSASEKVQSVISMLSECEQTEMPVTHRFSPGIYAREIFMAADTYVIGHIHRTRHLNVVLSGKCVVMMEGKRHEITGPCTFESGEGVQKILHILEDTRWMTIHANPLDESDVATIEESLVVLDAELTARKGALTLDELRMSQTRQSKALQ